MATIADRQLLAYQLYLAHYAERINYAFASVSSSKHFSAKLVLGDF